MPAGAWRLILDGPGDGAWNMAVDRALHVSRARGSCQPTLRIYRWTRPTVTLGTFQSAEAVDAVARERYGIDVVRRATGGRGVLHDDEVTYSIVAGLGDGIPKGVVASYRLLCAGIVAAFVGLGVPAQLTARDRGRTHSAACYLHATPADVSVGALKLSGSAQVWKGDTVLQHGSFVRTRDIARESAVFGLSVDDQRALAQTTATISSLTGTVPEFPDMEAAIVAGFASGLDLTFKTDVLTDDEMDLAVELLASQLPV